MTKNIPNRPAPIQEQRHEIRPTALLSAPIFQGWGPKF